MENFDKTNDSAWPCLPEGWRQSELLPNSSSALRLLSTIQQKFLDTEQQQPRTFPRPPTVQI